MLPKLFIWRERLENINKKKKLFAQFAHANVRAPLKRKLCWINIYISTKVCCCCYRCCCCCFFCIHLLSFLSNKSENKTKKKTWEEKVNTTVYLFWYCYLFIIIFFSSNYMCIFVHLKQALLCFACLTDWIRSCMLICLLSYKWKYITLLR